MRVGIYNRWLSTLGGGEKYSLGIAEYVSQFHAVDVISHQAVEKERAANILALDMSRVKFLIVPDQTAYGISAISRGYDLFINASFMDFFPAMSRHSASVIFFPAKLNTSVSVRRKLKQMIRRMLQLPDMAAGVQNFEAVKSGIRWDLDTAARILLPPSQRPFRLKFGIQALDERVSQVKILVGGNQVATQKLHIGRAAEHCDILIPASSGQGQEIAIEVMDEITPDGKPKLNLEQLNMDLPAFQFYRSFFEHRYTGWALKFQYNPPAYAILDYLKTYDVIWAISEFTRKWIRTYWHCDSEILYPMVDVDRFEPKQKRNQILNVGRFFAGNHNKKHLEMIKAFRMMVDGGLKDWELHLAGGTAPDEMHQQYFEEVRQAAEGYPIILHPNFPYGQLVDLYSESAIYWHASGFGEDESRDPVRFEHFGITTVEAMASGCCPVVIAKGGQPEVVKHGKSGYLWRTLEELCASTLKLIHDPELRNRISMQAVLDSKSFGRENFHAQVQQYLNKIVN